MPTAADPSRRSALSTASARVLVLALAPVLAACRSTPPAAPIASPEAIGFDAAKLAAVRADLEDQVRRKKVAGAVALVARHGKTALFEAVGMQDAEARVAMDRAAIFRICSMTKAVTSVAAMMLVEEGKVSLDDPVSRFIPEFAEVKVAKLRPGTGDREIDLVPAERPVTVRHLLTHTSGLAYGLSNREPISRLYAEAGVSDGLIETDGTMEENARKIAKAPLLFQPGTGWEYGLSVDVLGRVVEVASGKTLEEFFEERIFRPLGMADTGFRLPAGKRDRLAAAYRPAAGGGLERIPDGPVHAGASVYSTTYPLRAGNRFFSGGAGLVSTAWDYSRFLQMLLAGGELEGKRLLRKETVEAMTRDQLGGLEPSIKSHGDAFGLGFGVVTEKGKDLGLGSPGAFSWGGFYFTYFWVDPRKDLIALVFAQLQPWGEQTLWADFRKRVYDSVRD